MTDHRLVAAIILSTGVIAGCGAADEGAQSTADATDAAPASSTDAAGYPEAYRELELPILPDGVVTSAGRQSTSLRDGLSIHISTDQPTSDVRAFYQEQMMSNGWTATSAGPGAALLPNMPIANVTFTKGELTFRATITSAAPGSTVQITVVER